MASRKTNVSDLPTLDLHGYKKEAAIRRLTDFLENQHQSNTSSWVCVITGTGSHSTCGPVLRTAVEKLLCKRKMTFERNTPGSFLIQAASGHVLYNQQQEEDSKVVVRSSQEEEIALQLAYTRKHSQNLRRSESSPAFLEERRGDNRLLGTGPSLSEVAREERELEQAREESLESIRDLSKTQKKERVELERAVQISKAAKEREEQEEAELLRKAMELSEREVNQQQQEEEQILQQALKDSQKATVSHLSEQEMEQALQEALQQSMKEAAATEDEEERMIQEAMALSLR